MKATAAQWLDYSRMAIYALESLPIALSRRSQLKLPATKPPPGHFPVLKDQLRRLVDRDAANIKRGVYPLSLLRPGNPIGHFRRYADVMVDSFEVNRRVRHRDNAAFSTELTPTIESLPEYYRRNFHNQTDGYLTKESAERYGHQTELLFKGSLGMMRRVLLAPLLEWMREQERPLNVLDLGCGRGELTQIITAAIPTASVTALDLSTAYLNYAKESIWRSDNVSYVQGAAESMSYDNHFDAVVSGFLFHEVPLKTRRRILAKIVAALKPGAQALLIDSIQLGDRTEMDWALKQFPLDFHEPFYANYIRTPLQQDLPIESSGIATDIAFLSKSIAFIKGT